MHNSPAHCNFPCRFYRFTTHAVMHAFTQTTLMDRLLAQCGQGQTDDRAMDSNTLEKERGITILAKYTSFKYRGHLINALDTPGHADFGGEVER